MFAAPRIERLLLAVLAALSIACEPIASPFTDPAPLPSFDAQAAPSAAAAAADVGTPALSAPDPRATPSDAATAPLRDAGPVLQPLNAPDGGAARDAAASALSDAGTAWDAGAPMLGAQSAELCADGFARGDASLAVTRIAPFAPSPEGVTVCSDGEIFVTVDGPDEIRRVPLDGGAPESYAALTGTQPAGITCDERGRLFVAGYARRDGNAAPAILMVAMKGAAALPLPAPQGAEVGALNGIVAVEGIGVFASDTVNGNLLHARELPDGGFETHVVATDLLGANGLAYEPSARKLYMVTSFLPPRVLSFQVNTSGALDVGKEEATGSALTMYDGVAVASNAEIYVADYLGGAILRARDRSVVATVSDPASLAFRGGSLLVTSYHVGDTEAEGGLYALQLGVCGPANAR